MSSLKKIYASQAPYKLPTFKKVSEPLLAFWEPYLQTHLEFNISISDVHNFRIIPYYGLIFNQFDLQGEQYLINIDFGSEEAVTLSLPRSFLQMILDHFLDPLLPEHFNKNFICSILEIILADLIKNIQAQTGITIKLSPFEKSLGNFKSQWRVYPQDSDLYHGILVIGKEHIVKDFLDKLYVKAQKKKTINPLIPMVVFSVMRNIVLEKLKKLQLGEIIILMTKRHPINEPLILVGDKIILHTQLQENALQVIQEPSMTHNVEEIYMTMQNEDASNQPQEQEQEQEQEQAQAQSDADAHAEVEAGAEADETFLNIPEGIPTPEIDNNAGLPEPENELEAAINDYKVKVLFELNRLEMSAKEVAKISQGSVVNLHKKLTEDVFITVSGRTIASGEVVQIGQNFGVLIKEVFNG